MSTGDVERTTGAAGTQLTLSELLRLREDAASLAGPPPGIVASLFPGAFRASYHGRGLEFDETRYYQPGDDFRALDWRVTARTGKLHTKLFHEEREHSFFFLLDVGASMRFGTRVAYKWVIAARLAALLAWACAGRGDRVGGMLLGTGREPVFVPPRASETGIRQLLTLFLEANDCNLSESDLNIALLRLVQRSSPGSLVLILSDFQSDLARWQGALGTLAHRNEVAGIAVYDPLEARLPQPGRYLFSDGDERLEVNSTDQRLYAAYQQRFERHRSIVAEAFHRHRGRFLTLATNQDPLRILQRALGSRSAAGQP